MPIVTFGAEIWCLSEADYDKLCKFQIHIGKRIQRLLPRAPNSCSSFGLGWMRLVTFILIKKLLFALTILRLNENSLIRNVFVERSKLFEQDRRALCENLHNSPTFEIYNAASRFGVFNVLCDMACGWKTLCTKKVGLNTFGTGPGSWKTCIGRPSRLSKRITICLLKL